jgi:hypothetical protein
MPWYLDFPPPRSKPSEREKVSGVSRSSSAAMLEKRPGAALRSRVAECARLFTGDAGKASGRDRKTFRHSGGVQITVMGKSAREGGGGIPPVLVACARRALLRSGGLSAVGLFAQDETRDLTPWLNSVEAWDSSETRSGWSRTLSEAPRLYRIQGRPCRVFGHECSRSPALSKAIDLLR